MAVAPVKTLLWKSGRGMATLKEEDVSDEKKENSNIVGNTMRRSFSLKMNSIRSGASKTFDSVRGSFDVLSQKLKRGSTRRRYKLESINSPTLPPPGGRRTPVKMYSPFGIETPKYCKNTQRRGVYTPKKCVFQSPTGKFSEDVKKLENETQRFATVARQIVTRRSVRKINYKE